MVWDLDAGKVLCELSQGTPASPTTTVSQTPHTDPVVALCWSKDSSLITSSSSDGCVRTSHLTNSRFVSSRQILFNILFKYFCI